MKLSIFAKFHVFINFWEVGVEFESRISLGSVSEVVVKRCQILIKSGTSDFHFWITFVERLVSKTDVVRF